MSQTRLSLLVDHRNPGSLAARFRRRRFAVFEALVASLPGPLAILDLGGEQRFWEVAGFGPLAASGRFQVTLLNLELQPVSLPGFTAVAGNAADLSIYPDRSFDIVFSNSVIEHLETWENQQRMACEARRTGRRYFIQTPNRYFPLEPHFLVPGYQFFPLWLQTILLQRFNLGWYQRIPDRQAAVRHIRTHRLLTAAELRRLFPGCQIHRERLFGLTKSLTAISPSEDW